MIGAPNVNMFLYTPVVEKLWRQHEIWDGTYTFDDLLDIHEALWVKNENISIMSAKIREEK